MNTTQYTALENAALEAMLLEAVREKDAETFAVLVGGDEAKVQALLDGFFR